MIFPSAVHATEVRNEEKGVGVTRSKRELPLSVAAQMVKAA